MKETAGAYCTLKIRRTTRQPGVNPTLEGPQCSFQPACLPIQAVLSDHIAAPKPQQGAGARSKEQRSKEPAARSPRPSHQKTSTKLLPLSKALRPNQTCIGGCVKCKERICWPFFLQGSCIWPKVPYRTYLVPATVIGLAGPDNSGLLV